MEEIATFRGVTHHHAPVWMGGAIHTECLSVMLRLRDTVQKMETMVAKEGVHTQCSRSSAVQHSANNGNFSIFRAVLHCYALCVDEG